MLNQKSNNFPLSAGPQNMFSKPAVLIYLLFLEVAVLSIALMTNQIVWIYTAGIIGVPVLLFLLPIEPVVGLSIMVVTTGLDFLGRIAGGDENSLRLTYFHVAMLLTMASLIMNKLYKGKITIPSISLWLPLLSFTALLAISIIWSPDFQAAIFELARHSFMVILCAIVVMIVDTRWRVKIIFWIMILTTFAISILSVYQTITEGSIFAPIVNQVASDLGMPIYRTTGTFSNPNVLGLFLMAGIVLPFAQLFEHGISSNERFMLFVCLIGTSVGMVLTFSRSGWLSVFAGLFVIVLLNKKWSYIWYFFAVMFVLIVVLLYTKPVVVEAMFGRFLTIFTPSEDTSSSSRLSLIKSAIWMWQDHPILGVGVSGFQKLSYEYQDPNMPNALVWVRDAHTWQAKILAEQGLVGITIAVWLFITIIFDGLRSLRTIMDTYLKNTEIGMIALFCSFIVNFVFACDPFNNAFWISLGMIYAVILADRNEAKRVILSND